jgi:4a-hydroxytetrahydrobiopterin dehydratase
MDKLTQAELQAALADLDGWTAEGDAITKTFRFQDFIGSVNFVNALAEVAEEMQHHPDIDIRYNKVTLHLGTHSAGGVTQNDVTLARHADHRAR